MKCDELKYERLGDANKTYPASTLVIRKQYVDAAIAELKRENENIKDAFGGTTIAYNQVCDEYEQCNQELRATKRALWLARANRALEKIAWFKLWNASISTMNPEDGARQEFDKWRKNLGKLLKKSKEYL